MIKRFTVLFVVFAICISLGACAYRTPTSPTPTATIETIKPDDVVLGSVAVPAIKPRPIPTPTPTPVESVEPVETPKVYEIDEYEASLIAKTLYGEYRGEDKLQQAGVVWCILNRVDYYGGTIESVVTAPGQFHGYNKNHPVLDYLYDTTVDVLTRWYREKDGETDVGRVLPADYLWFGGNGTINRFRNAYSGKFDIWDWTLPDPYNT